MKVNASLGWKFNFLSFNCAIVLRRHLNSDCASMTG